jgi:trimeric autotransporter adhesin
VASSPEALRYSAAPSQQGGKNNKKFKQGVPVLLSKSASHTAILSLLTAQEASPAAIQLAKDVEQKKDAVRRLQEGSADAAADVAAAVTRLEAVKTEAAQAVAVVARYSSFGMARMDSLAADREAVAGQGAATRGQQGALLFLLNSVGQHVTRVEAALRALAALHLQQPAAVTVTASSETASTVTAAGETAGTESSDDVDDGYDGVARAVVQCLLAVSNGNYSSATATSTSSAFAAAAAGAQVDVNDELLSLDFDKVKAAAAAVSGSNSDAPTVEVDGAKLQQGAVDKEGQLVRAVLTEAVKASHLETRSSSSSPSRRRTTVAKRSSTAPGQNGNSGQHKRRRTTTVSKGKRSRPSTVGSIAEGSSVSSGLATDSVTLDASVVDSTAASSSSGTVAPLLTAASVTADGIAPQQQYNVQQQQQQQSPLQPQYEHRSGKRQSLLSELAEIDQLAAAAHHSAPLIASSSAATAAADDAVAQQTAAYFAELDAATEPLQQVEDEFGIGDAPSSTTGSSLKLRETKEAESLRLAQTYEAAISGVFSAERAAAAAAAAAAEAAAQQQQLAAGLAAVTSAGAAAAAAARSDAASTASTASTTTAAADADRCWRLDSGDAPRSAQPLVLFLNGLGSRRARDDYPEPPAVPVELSLPAGKLHPTHEHKASLDSYLLLNFTVERPAVAAVAAVDSGNGSSNKRAAAAAAVAHEAVHSEDQLRAMWCTILSSTSNTASTTASSSEDIYEQASAQQQQQLKQQARWQRRCGKQRLGCSVSVQDEKAVTRERYTGDDASTVQLQTPGPFLWLGRLYHCGGTSSTDTTADECDGRESRMNTTTTATISDVVEAVDGNTGEVVDSSVAVAASERDDRAYTEDAIEVQHEAPAVPPVSAVDINDVSSTELLEIDGDALVTVDTELNSMRADAEKQAVDTTVAAAAVTDSDNIVPDSTDVQKSEVDSVAVRQPSAVSKTDDDQHSAVHAVHSDNTETTLAAESNHDNTAAVPESASSEQITTPAATVTKQHSDGKHTPHTTPASPTIAAVVSSDERATAQLMPQHQRSSNATGAAAVRDPLKHAVSTNTATAAAVPVAAASTTIVATSVPAKAAAAVNAAPKAVVDVQHAVQHRVPQDDNSVAAASDSASIGSGWDAASSSTITPRTITTATARAARCSSASSRGISSALHPRHSSSRHKQRQQQQQQLQRHNSGSISSGSLPLFAGGKRSSWNDPGTFFLPLYEVERSLQERPVTMSHYERPPSLFDPVVKGVLVRASSSSNSGTGNADRDSTLYKLSDEALAAVRSNRSKTAKTRKKRGLDVVGLRALPQPSAAAVSFNDTCAETAAAQQHILQEQAVAVENVPRSSGVWGDVSTTTTNASHGHVLQTPELVEQRLQHSGNGSSAVSALLYHTAAATSGTASNNSNASKDNNNSTRKLSERGTSPLRGSRIENTIPLQNGVSHPETSPSSTSPHPGTDSPGGSPRDDGTYTDSGRISDVSAIRKSLSQSLLQQANVRTLGQRPLTGASSKRGKLFKTKPQPLLMPVSQQQHEAFNADIGTDATAAAAAVQLDDKLQSDANFGPLSIGLGSVCGSVCGSVHSFNYSSSDVSAVLAQSRAATARSTTTAQRKARSASKQDAKQLFDGLAACDWDVRGLGADAVVARAATANTSAGTSGRTLLHSKSDGAVRGTSNNLSVTVYCDT